MHDNNRPDLSERHILLLLMVVAAAGSLLLLAPLLFLVMKRSGMSASPPTWFAVHVLASMLGCTLIFAHVAGGDWLTPPGLVLLLLVALILQGTLLRVVFARGFSRLFARNCLATGFGTPPQLDKPALRQLIDAKTGLLQRLDPGAELGWSRRIHLLIALGFYLGLLAHVIVMLFFAGYAAGSEAIDWWHITAWGG